MPTDSLYPVHEETFHDTAGMLLHSAILYTVRVFGVNQEEKIVDKSVEVKCILNHRRNKQNEMEYFVQWADDDSKEWVNQADFRQNFFSSSSRLLENG